MVLHTFILHLARQLGIASKEKLSAKPGQGYHLVKTKPRTLEEALLFRELVHLRIVIRRDCKLKDTSEVTLHDAQAFRRIMLAQLGFKQMQALEAGKRREARIVDNATSMWQEVIDEYLLSQGETSPDDQFDREVEEVITDSLKQEPSSKTPT